MSKASNMSMISTIVRSASLHRNFRKTSKLSYSVWKSVKCNNLHQNGSSLSSHQNNVLIRFNCGPNVQGARLNARYLTTSTVKTKEASSKTAETVERLKEKEKSKEPETLQPLEPSQKVATTAAPPIVKDEQIKVVDTTAKKSLWIRFKDEVRHYYSGFKLLCLDVNVSSKIMWKIVKGKSLTRRESRQLVRTTSDVFRLVPFSVFVIVPFMELLLPVALKLFPGMLPSTFTTSSQREEKLKKALQAKLEYTRFLQKTLDGMGPKASGSRTSKSAADFAAFYQEIKKSSEDRSNILDNDKIMKFAKVFEDDITLDNMDRSQLSAICRLLNLTPIGTSNFLRLQIELKLRGLKADDRLIQKEGMDRMSHNELQNANLERGMPAFGLSEERLKAQLGEWIDLSLNYKVPPSLLLLSRTLYNIDNLAPTQKIASAISALPEKAASATSATIGEREGKIRNVDRLEQIKDEQRKIEEEAKEQAKIEERKRKEQAETLKPVATPELPPIQAKVVESVSPIKKATVTDVGEVKDAAASDDDKYILVDKAPILVDKAPEMEPQLPDANEEVAEVLQEAKKDPKKMDTAAVSTASLSDLKVAIESLGIAVSEEETVKKIRKELDEYDEDVRELDEVKNLVSRLDLRESMAAKLLFGRVNKILKRTDNLVAKLQKRKEKIHEKIQAMAPEDNQKDEHKEQIVTIQEIIEAVNKLQKSHNQDKVDQIAQVLSMMDADADGVIKVDHVLKVIELLGNQNTELPAKQIKQIINVLCEEEKLLLEDSIEDILIKKTPKQEEPEVDQALQEELDALEKIACETGSETTSGTSVSAEAKISSKSKSSESQPQPTQQRSRNGENH